MFLFAIIYAGILSIAGALPTNMISDNDVLPLESYNFTFVSRNEWHARISKGKTPLQTPVPYVVIHHSYIPPACYNRQQCVEAMQSMQNFHMDDRGWWDIGYNFGVGSDGVAYEGRGWELLGAHSLHFNTVSIGICLIGDWTKDVPPTKQIKTAKALIAAGVQLGYIKSDYKLIGHRQVRDTECPGDALFEDIKHWNHWSKHPSSYLDLANLSI